MSLLEAAHLEHDPDQLYCQPYVLVLSNGAGDGLALQGSRRDLLDYLHRAHEHLAQNTSRQAELGEVGRQRDLVGFVLREKAAVAGQAVIGKIVEGHIRKMSIG